MLAAIKKLILFLDLVINHGISPSTILSNKKPLNHTFLNKFNKDQDKHGV